MRPQSAAVPEQVKAAQAGLADVVDGLVSFQLHPKNAAGKQIYSGIQKLKHLAKLARRSVPSSTTLRPSAYLDVEYSVEQQGMINPKPADFAMHSIAAHVHGKGAQQATL